MAQITKKSAIAVSAKLDDMANTIQKLGSALGIPTKIAKDFAFRCDLLSDHIEKRAGFDPSTIGQEVGGPLEQDSDEDYMKGEFTGQERRELREAVEGDLIGPNKTKEAPRAPKPGAKVAAKWAVDDDESIDDAVAAEEEEADEIEETVASKKAKLRRMYMAAKKALEEEEEEEAVEASDDEDADDEDEAEDEDVEKAKVARVLAGFYQDLTHGIKVAKLDPATRKALNTMGASLLRVQASVLNGTADPKKVAKVLVAAKRVLPHVAKVTAENRPTLAKMASTVAAIASK